jgi:hypothetical protein
MSGRRTKNAKRANNAAARELLENHYREKGLEGIAPPTSSVTALSKIISSGDTLDIAKILASSTKYAKGKAMAPVNEEAPVQQKSKKSRKSKKSKVSRIKLNFTKKAAPRSKKVRALPTPPPNKCMTECALACMAKEKETPFVRTLSPVASMPSMPSSTQELRELFSNLSPAREAPVRRRLRRLGEIPAKPYYHQRTNTTLKKGRRAKTMNYRG